MFGMRLAALMVAMNLLLASALAGGPAGLWTTIDEDAALRARADRGPEWVRPAAFHAVELDGAGMEDALAGAPHEDNPRARTHPAVLTIPMPDGSFEAFELVEVETMAPELRAWMDAQGHPMRTYRGVGIDDPHATIRADWGGPGGFHASIHRGFDRSWVHIDRLFRDDTTTYASYVVDDLPPMADWQCLVDDSAMPSERLPALFPEEPGEDRARATGGRLRSYRMACAATGEYTQFHGGTVAQGQAAIVTAFNRVNQVFERDLAVRFVLVPNNQDLVFTNAATDPYSNFDNFAMLQQNITTVNGIIGFANYDIGHVLATGGGGVAFVGAVCGTNKAGGVSGAGSPTGDGLWIRVLSHEIGHQLGARHTFNGQATSCLNNRTGSAAYEPGSGITIMSYAGICGSDNIASAPIPFFHTHSLSEMLATITSTNCQATGDVVNPSAPVVTLGPSRFIPANTPIWLEPVSVTEADGDPVTYSWEQYNLGPQEPVPTVDSGSGPITRVWQPTTDPVRTIPRLVRLRSGTSDVGEILPSTTRSMAFRLTARDNNPEGGRVGIALLSLNATTAAGPFVVTGPAPGTSASGFLQVTWDVANTDLPPVNAPNVDILLSTNDGLDFPIVLAEGVPNTGSALVPLPSIETSAARVLVKGTDQYFFNISPGPFQVEPPSGPILSIAGDLLVDDTLGNGNGNGRLDPGEEGIGILFSLTNPGSEAAVGSIVELSSPTPGVEVLNPSIFFGPLLPGGTRSLPEPFLVSIDASVACGTQIAFEARLRENSGFDQTQTRTALVGAPGDERIDIIYRDFESSPGWTVDTALGPNRWARRTRPDAPSGTQVASYEPGHDGNADVRMVTEAFAAEQGRFVEFLHSFDIELSSVGVGWDGAALEIQVGGGAWQDAEPYFVEGGYNGIVRSDSSSALAGRPAWVGGGFGPYEPVVLDLSPLAGEPSVRLRFRKTADVIISSGGWRIDDFRVFELSDPVCEAPAEAPALPSSWILR